MKEDTEILLVEDDDVDALTVKRAFKELKITNPLSIRKNGEEALEYLRSKIDHLPALILMDINMPRMNGIELLKTLKADEILRKIPVVMLTTSREERDKMQSFYQGAAGYIIKPVDYQQFIEAVRILDVYWTLNELPDDLR